MPQVAHPFAAERALRQLQALLEGQQFESIEEVNARLEILTGEGRLAELAAAWTQNDPKWRAQDLAYDALETDDLGEALWLADQALKLDPECTDAQRLIVAVLPMSPENRVQLMREVVERAEKNLGEHYIKENAGDFWGIVATRPYMRAKGNLAELLLAAGDSEEASSIYERMLELDRSDRQGVRFALLGLYLGSGNLNGARGVMSRFRSEEKHFAAFAWARVLERWLSGNLKAAKEALARARKINRFVEPYLTGARRLPRRVPEYFQPGEESEARLCMHELAAAWERHPAFREWVRAAMNPDSN